MNCRHCAQPLHLPLVDLCSAPPSNAYLTTDSLNKPEKWYPLRVMVCTHCWLVQTEDYAHFAELFDDDYAYFSSFSSSWLIHAEKYVHTMAERFKLKNDSMVVEIAANDGYLLQYVKGLGIPCLGIEPTHSTAVAARAKDINIIEEFFTVELANDLVKKGFAADLTAANNVLAHVPDINDFVKAFSILLKPQGVATFEFPHLLQMMEHTQFDTIYHEHFSYLSLTAVQRIFAANGLTVFDVETLPTHGGSLRVYAQRSDTGEHIIQAHVEQLLTKEREAGVTTQAYYADFQNRSNLIKNNLMAFLVQAKHDNKKVAAYGAAAKGNTLMNYAGVRPDLIEFVVDKNPAKQDKFMPGTRLPIRSEDALKDFKPDYVIILPWNLKSEVTEQLSYIEAWGGQFVVAVPELSITAVKN